MVRRVRGGPAADDPAVLDHADNSELIVATPLSLSSPSATGLSALAPAQRAGAQRLRAVAHRVISLLRGN